MSVDEAVFRQAMSRFASGVTVVTTKLVDKLFGITVSAFASLSLEPRLVLVCIEKTAPSHRGIAKAGFFAVNLLAEDQEHLSRHFAAPLADKFAGIHYRAGTTGAPLLDGCLATLECRLVDQLPGGDHTIFVGEVLHAAIYDGAPLVYFRSTYGRLASE